MKRRLLSAAAIACLLASSASVASAERYVSNGGYQAYIGDNNYAYLQDPTGVTKVLQTATRDLLSMTDTHLFCLTMDHRLYSIDLSASTTSLVAASPSQEALDAVTAKEPFTLTNGTLTVPGTNGQPVVIANGVTMAKANGTNLYFMDNSGASLKSIPLDQIGTGLVPATQIGPGAVGALSMSVTENGLVIVAADHSLILVNLTNNTFRYEAAPSADTAMAILVGNDLYYYTQDADGVYHAAGRRENVMAADPSQMSVQNAMAEIPNRPTATPAPTATPRHTATPTPRPTAKPSSSDDSSPTYATVYYGNSGSRVTRMQKRLAKLGYPVGKADGSFGDNTLYALNLFQGDIGHTERKYANSSTLERLYASKAPTYDAFRGLKRGNKGIRVTILQNYLAAAGFAPGTADGVYGANTQTAVKKFQLACGIPATGEADKTTLILLYGDQGPVNPYIITPTAAPVYPTNLPTTIPTSIPTAIPVPDPKPGTSTDL